MDEPKVLAGAQASQTVGEGAEPQVAAQGAVKAEYQVKLESQPLAEADTTSALSKRNPNVPSPSKVKNDLAVKTPSLGHDAENVSVNGSSTSSPIKNTPSKAPKASYARA